MARGMIFMEIKNGPYNFSGGFLENLGI